MQLSANSLLVIIDPQQDFLDPAGPYAKRHSGIVQMQTAQKNIQSLLNEHPAALVVHANYEPEQFGAGLFFCIEGSAGAAIALDLPQQCTRMVKRQHSCFSAKEFVDYLVHHQIEHLVLCGFLAEYCVRQTAIDGLAAGYRISLQQACIGTADDQQMQAQQVLQALVGMGAAIIN
jgi:nicotinamidase/pyrazinamidase